MIRTARYLGVPPWELEERPGRYYHWGRVCQDAEIWAENEEQAHANARMRNQR